MRYEGNIFRPPGEWRSYLLQVTVGCSHNKCTFCSMYKDKRFHIRPLTDIFEDIEMAGEYHGRLGRPVKRVFLCDGDAIIMKTDQLLAILNKLYDTFPMLERVTAYAGPRSTLTKTPEELKALREAGLYRVYLGVETGDDALLHQIKKGVDAAEMLEAGVRLREAGLDLWVMVLLGLAGPGEPSRRHILATAKMMNEMKPRHLSALTLMAEPGTELGEQVARGEFQLITGEEALMETRLLLEHLDVDPLHFTCDHASNYLPLKGGLPEDRDAMIAAIDRALQDKDLMRSEYGRAL
ncbi:radical SAM protein [Pseudoflavonifractor sp. MSJ-37]|uniref:radical SAM protein n=1 Tax=Pseudoflavonifractor sp. MSJ-37 TaxID=2841531 RepID=UPI001C0F6915|nr:radical SAM protein [Pseudoflavonifractor sp. MSJ-37]MBU5434903.1 radical SAM protein [Pseudoflavonifractor sp. MSJ-37]